VRQYYKNPTFLLQSDVGFNSGIIMNQFLRPVGFFGLCGLLFLPSSGQSNDDMRSMQNPKVSQHMAFIDVNRAKLGTLKDTDFGSSCSASYRRSAFRAGYAQATQMTSTVEIASDDLNTPETAERDLGP
jgi:hypothetical protein